MKIAICNVQEFNPVIGGIERVSVSLAKCLIERGVYVLFIACRKSPYSKDYELPAEQIMLPDDCDYSANNVDKCAEIIRDKNIDIIINQNSHSEQYNRFCFEVKAKTDVKLISVFHFAPNMRIISNRNLFNIHNASLKKNIEYIFRDLCTRFPFTILTMHSQKRLMRNLYKNSDKIVLLSDKFIKQYKQIAKIDDVSKLTSINNMLSFTYNIESFAKKKQILFCGRLSYKQKRPDRLLQIWSLIQDKIPEWNIVILGDGPYLKELKKISTKLKLKRIAFHGFQEPIKYYKESSIFCMTSNHEGFGMVLTEAMQFGCVPFAFNSFDSLVDIIDNEHNGFIIPPFDLEMYGNKIINLIKSGALETFSKNAILSMDKFSQNRITDKWMYLIKHIIEE